MYIIITWSIILFVNSCNFTVPERFGEVKADVRFTKEGIPQVTFMIEVMLDPNVLYNVIIIAMYVISWDTIIQHLQTGLLYNLSIFDLQMDQRLVHV